VIVASCPIVVDARAHEAPVHERLPVTVTPLIVSEAPVRTETLPRIFVPASAHVLLAGTVTFPLTTDAAIVPLHVVLDGP